MRDQPVTHKIGHSCIITSCLSLIIGLVLIVTGVISETKKTTFIGIGIITLGVGFFLTTIVCFYAKLKICYRNWAYGPPISPLNMELSQQTTMFNA
ncbi:unnamed protein product [Adineta steineri]|uniref:Uncharacterized protein n=1 Tax=Adineta steineri TaxID=433720 RepID=A0A814VXK4_9BILA|nr:unnamed protein product [Adineta steineri]